MSREVEIIRTNPKAMPEIRFSGREMKKAFDELVMRQTMSEKNSF